MEELPFAVILELLFSAVSLLMVWRVFAWRRRRIDAMERAAPTDGGMVVPVVALHMNGRQSGNSLNPSMSITPDGISFRVLSRRFWKFTEIDHVDVRKTMFGVSLTIVQIGRRDRVEAHLRNVPTAKRVIAALPPSLQVNADAAIVGHDNDAAQAPGSRPRR